MTKEEKEKLFEIQFFDHLEIMRLRNNIIKALHRIQLLQMDGEVTIADLGLIVRDLKGE